MNSDSYHQARNAAVKDLAKAVSEDKLLQQRIARLKQTIASLDALIEGEEAASEWKRSEQMGITDACRQALKVANSPRTAIEVRDWLANSGYELSEQENALASIHTVLKRLVKAGEAAVGTNADGKATYEWIGERSDSITTAVQQANYEVAKRLNNYVKEALSGLVFPHSEAAKRTIETNANAARHAVKLKEVQDRAEKTAKLLEGAKPKK